MAKTHTIHLTEEQMGVLLDAVRTWDNMLAGRFSLVEPWDWPGSYSPDEKSYRKTLKECLALVSDE